MGIGLIFWILMLIWLVFGFWVNWNAGTPNPHLIGGNVMLFILLLLLGWQAFGAPIH
jgi:O-antigen ligase